MNQMTLVLGSAERVISQLELAYINATLEFFVYGAITYRAQQLNPEVFTYLWSVDEPAAFELLLVKSLLIDTVYIEVRGLLDENVDKVAGELAELLGAASCANLICQANNHWQEQPAVLARAALGCPYDSEKYDDKITMALLSAEEDFFRMGVFSATLLPRNVAQSLLNGALECDMDEKREAFLQRILADNTWGLPPK